MALTRLQARSRYIIGSMAMFLDRNLKQAYDAEAASLPYPTPLTIRRGKPDDLTIVRAAPSIAIDITTAPDGAFYELGTNSRWRYLGFAFSCYPAITTDGDPSDEASELLKSYMQDAFGTYAIKILDYSNPAFSASNILYCFDLMEICKVGVPIPRNATTALAEEKHRFDFHVQVRYPVEESNAT